MQLIQLDHKYYEIIKDKPIYIVACSKDVLSEMCETYDILDRIKGIIRQRKTGEFEFKDRKFYIESQDVIPMLPDNAVFLIVSYRHQSYYNWLSKMPDIKLRYSTIYYYQGKESYYNILYREKYRYEPLKDIIIFRSGPGVSEYVRGTDFADNSRALFEYMLSKRLNDKYKLVWLVKDPKEFIDKYKIYHNVRFISFDAAISEDKSIRDEYYEMIYLAKYFFVTESRVFARNRREDQICVQLWHGQGFKTRVAKSRDEKAYEYMVVTSGYYGLIHAESFGLRPDQMIVTGSPKEDYLYHPIPRWKERFCIPEASKYIFWLPTFRTPSSSGFQHMKEFVIHQETGLPIMESVEMIQQLNDELKKRDTMLIVKLHPYQKRSAIAKWRLSNIYLLEIDSMVREDVQINQLLGHSDALISDYSSVAVDYMLLDRPIAFTMDDYKQYQENRGFHWSNIRDYLPGEELYTYSDFVQFIDHISQGKDLLKEKRRKLNLLFHNFDDGNNSDRLIKTLEL